jgi:hypothetical protein
MIRDHDNKDETYGDSDFLAYRDIATNEFRKDEKESKIHLIKKMLELRHNMKYNKHLQSVYLKAKQLFDNMVEEHRSQIFYLEEIYGHINNIIREHHTNPQRKTNLTSELVKDKKRIGLLLKKMRNSYEKLTNVYTVIDVTIQKIDEIIASIEEAQSDTDTDFDAEAELDSEADEAELDSEADEADEADEAELDSEADEAELDSEADEAELDSEAGEAGEAELDSEADEAELDSEAGEAGEAELDSEADEADDADDAELDSEAGDAELDSEAGEAELDSEADEADEAELDSESGDELVIMRY